MSKRKPTDTEASETNIRSDKISFQLEFLAKLGTQQQFRQLFEHLPGIYFFVKDAQSRMICASGPIVRRLGFSREEEIIGTTDFDFFPPQVADNFIRDDRQVMESGRPLIGRVEVWYNEQRILDWFVTNKMPLHDGSGRAIGLMGTIQSYDDKQSSLAPFFEITRVVEYIRAHHQRQITVEQLAELIQLSPRQLRRKFSDVFGMSVQEFLMKTRIQAASDALVNSGSSISEIALRFGFCDQSAFTQQFRKHMGLTPLKYRHKYARLSSAAAE
ncbi:MAG: AraC family transcriptional regulator [Pirellulales bacterium]|nr:AraC family transcriptional regulator [Pirellulales bacterium]